ncbi:helix-turn-helix transcriptional regulator [Streptomyces sp. NPDC019531]|uniref:helix-turn-helix transcriptional regulator n=1 Tax=Streptomyces sp. NPDC019531 TaxID=3365062 RepID=UPI00384CA9DD
MVARGAAAARRALPPHGGRLPVLRHRRRERGAYAGRNGLRLTPSGGATRREQARTAPAAADQPAPAAPPAARARVRSDMASASAPQHWCGRPGREHSPERGRLLAVLRDQLRASPQQPLRLPGPTDPGLSAVCALVHADPAHLAYPAGPRTLAALGAATGASERTLSRLFRREFGMAFTQWRTRSRLCHALRMLADGVPVTTVAHRCDQPSASAFIDVFRRSFGHTPGTHNRRSP